MHLSCYQFFNESIICILDKFNSQSDVLFALLHPHLKDLALNCKQSVNNLL